MKLILRLSVGFCTVHCRKITLELAVLVYRGNWQCGGNAE